ncbi:MAG: PaaI family thioesterase [Alphaproteobacteria bacterium]|nr:PaaI family thioesterase [Alphaproteobacteria bacterium]
MTTPLTKEQIQAGLQKSPFIVFLGLEVVSVDAEKQEIVVRAPMRPEFERGKGSKQWHGGPIAGVIDTVGDYALVMAIGRPLPTINFRVDYLRPAIDTDLTAIARVRRHGKSVGVVDIDVLDAKQNLVAVGRASYSTLPPAA